MVALIFVPHSWVALNSWSSCLCFPLSLNLCVTWIETGFRSVCSFLVENKGYWFLFNLSRYSSGFKARTQVCTHTGITTWEIDGSPGLTSPLVLPFSEAWVQWKTLLPKGVRWSSGKKPLGSWMHIPLYDMSTCRHVFMHTHLCIGGWGFVDHKKMDFSVVENHWSIVRVYLYLFFCCYVKMGHIKL